MEAQTVKKKYPCPYCDASFDSETYELGPHIYKFHRDKATQPQQPPTIIHSGVKTLTPPPTHRTVKPQATQQEELIVEYSLAESKQGLGELCAVLKDKDGNIIDGFHRKGENQNWREETLPWIDTPVKLELARLAVNFNRRRVTSQELSERITFLLKAGVSVEEIAKQTGISPRTIYRYKPAGLKNPVKVEARKTESKVEQSESQFDDTVHHTAKISDKHSEAPPRTEIRFQEKVQVDAEPPQTVDIPATIKTPAPQPEDQPEAHSSFTREEHGFGAQADTEEVDTTPLDQTTQKTEGLLYKLCRDSGCEPHITKAKNDFPRVIFPDDAGPEYFQTAKDLLANIQVWYFKWLGEPD
ncbi:MAG: helix-turn-helix domain-containing protein [Candidatus Bathyarchaeia archaeon]|jgi:hypothetical protein